jgi:hypothetical protein
MMNQAIVGQMDADEFDDLLETFVEQRAGEDDRLPAQTFFELLAARQATREPLEIHISWLGTEPVVTAPPDAPVTIEGRRIRLDDGRELVLHFEPQTTPV